MLLLSFLSPFLFCPISSFFLHSLHSSLSLSLIFFYQEQHSVRNWRRRTRYVTSSLPLFFLFFSSSHYAHNIYIHNTHLHTHTTPQPIHTHTTQHSLFVYSFFKKKREGYVSFFPITSSFFHLPLIFFLLGRGFGEDLERMEKIWRGFERGGWKEWKFEVCPPFPLLSYPS